MTSCTLPIVTLFPPLHSLQGVYGGFKPSKLPAVPGLEGKVLCLRQSIQTNIRPGLVAAASPFFSVYLILNQPGSEQ